MVAWVVGTPYIYDYDARAQGRGAACRCRGEGTKEMGADSQLVSYVVYDRTLYAVS